MISTLSFSRLLILRIYLLVYCRKKYSRTVVQYKLVYIHFVSYLTQPGQHGRRQRTIRGMTILIPNTVSSSLAAGATAAADVEH